MRHTATDLHDEKKNHQNIGKCVYWVRIKVNRGTQSDVCQRQLLHGISWSPNGTYASPFQGLSEDSRTPLRCKSATGEECTDTVPIRYLSGVLKEKNCTAFGKNCFIIRVSSNVRSEKTHTFCCCEFNTPLTALALQSIVQQLKHEHYDTKYCGTQTYVYNKQGTKYNIKRTSAHFVALPLPDNIVELMRHPIF